MLVLYTTIRREEEEMNGKNRKRKERNGDERKGKEWKGENKVFIEVDIPRINILFVESKKESEER